MYIFADRYRLKLLKGTARRLMTANFMSVVSTAEFAELPMVDLIEYMGDDDVNADTEDSVLEAGSDSTRTRVHLHWRRFWNRSVCSSRHAAI